MLEIEKTPLTLDEQDLLDLERILVDRDEKEAFVFLKQSVYEKLRAYQRGK